MPQIQIETSAVVARPSSTHVIVVRGFEILSRDDVHHSASGGTAIQRRGGAAYDFDALHVGEIDARIVHIVHRLPSHALAIDQEEEPLSAKSAKIQVDVSRRRVGKLHIRQFVREEFAEIAGITSANVVAAYDKCGHRSLCPELGAASACDHSRREGGVGGRHLWERGREEGES